MRKYLKSAGVILVVSALLITALGGCKSETGDANSSSEQANTTSQTLINDTYTSDNEKESAHAENKKENTPPKTEENTASAADNTTNPTESAKVSEPSKIPQLPSSQKGWANAAASLYELIEKTVSSYKIDKSNISLTGHSMGGTGTYNIACSYPSLFARIAPLSGSVRGTPDTIEKLKNIPIKAFVGSADTIVPPQSSEEVIAGLKRTAQMHKSPCLTVRITFQYRLLPILIKI